MGAVGNFGSEYCHKCQVGCSDYNYGPCIYYRGPAIDWFEVKKWQDADRVSLQEVTTEIGTRSADYFNRNYVDVECMGLVRSEPGPATKLALEKLCGLNTDDVGVKNTLFCLGKSSTVHSAVLGTRAITFSVSPTDQGHSNFNYNMEEALNGLPDGYVISRKEVEVFSYGPATTLESRLVKTADVAGQFILKGDQFPIGLVFSIDVGTPGGLVTMSKRVTLDSPRPQMSPVILEIEDRTSKSNGSGLKQTEFNTLVESAICNINNRIDGYRYIGLAGCDKVKYFDKSVQGAVGVHSGHLCTIYGRLDNLGAEKIQGIDCQENCEKRVYDTTVQEHEFKQDNAICAAQLDLRTLFKELADLKLRVETCCANASSAAINGQG